MCYVKIRILVGHIADTQSSYKHFGIPQSHGNHDAVARKTATSKKPPKNQSGPEGPAEWEEQDQCHQHVRSASHQTLCWYSELAKGHGSC